MLTWNNFEFFKCALTQALFFCDEVIVIEGCHLNGFSKQSTGKTREYIQTIKNPKLVVIDIQNFDYKIRNNLLQCQLRETYLKQSKYWEPDNWVIQWDDDTFYFNKDLLVIKELMQTTNADILTFRERRFAFNFRFNILSNVNKLHTTVFQRIKPGCRFEKPSKIRDKNGLPYTNILKMPEIIFHHYPYVKLTARSKFRWAISVAKGCTENEITGNLWDNFSWNNDSDIFKHENVFRKIIGGSPEAKLNIYDGPHPEILDSHPWKNLNDIRILN
jgi:hypothetical protein